MARYEIEIMCEHIETRSIDATTKQEAIDKILNGDYAEIIDWHLEGKICIQSVTKNGKELSFRQ